MARTRQIISGLFALTFALLGMYCAVRGIQAHRELNGRLDLDESVRNWTTGSSACFVGCAIAIILGKQKRATASGDPSAAQASPARGSKNPVIIVLAAAVVFVIVMVAILLLRPSPPQARAPVTVPIASQPAAPPGAAARGNR